MTLYDLRECGIIEDETYIIVKAGDVMPRGRWYEDQILFHADEGIKKFTWTNNDRILVELEE